MLFCTISSPTIYARVAKFTEFAPVLFAKYFLFVPMLLKRVVDRLNGSVEPFIQQLVDFLVRDRFPIYDFSKKILSVSGLLLQ